ncbi:hypothetical protein DMR_01120 [Solidesulfovibrio magneticus RS-1]|uniref:Uncharacterized protein n=1 Tax=Solidesulfovibrio magneticus (strain ATCC 700980 / DSM 13731 / RS-1) TaxID=573370 RepID=C4XTT8_SOLM1|nr:hypothetical protein DMR_01120 [Solidesulfovibrio magneticus RS-1]
MFNYLGITEYRTARCRLLVYLLLSSTFLDTLKKAPLQIAPSWGFRGRTHAQVPVDPKNARIRVLRPIHVSDMIRTNIYELKYTVNRLLGVFYENF